MINIDQKVEILCEETKEGVINLAAVCPSTQALGPGKRAVIWVQGCPFKCPGCLSPEWARQDVSSPVSVERLERYLRMIHFDGLTISGGEPMQQAPALTALLRRLRCSREFDVICYTGYRLEDLLLQSGENGRGEFLSEIDVLIDGPYIEALNDNRGLRGSSNQKIHFLSGRLSDCDFVSGSRMVELNIDGDELFVTGIPGRRFRQTLDSAFCSIGFLLSGGQNERV